MIQPEILYEDAQLIICYKPAGIATQTKKLGQKDMVSILLNHVAQEGTGQPFIGVVHRLDQPVEGVMVFAKTKQAAAKLSAQVKDHSFGKKYYAKVRLPEGKTFEQATGHEKTGTLQDWIQFEPKENKSCVIEQKQRENEREDIRHPADGKRLQLQKPRHTATSQNKIQEAVLDYQVLHCWILLYIPAAIIRSVYSLHILELRSAEITNMERLKEEPRHCAVIISILFIRSVAKR